MTTQGTSATFMLARLFKLPRLMRTARVIKKFHQLSKTTAFQLSYVLFCTFTLAHWAACGFFFLARWEVCAGTPLLKVAAPVPSKPAGACLTPQRSFTGPRRLEHWLHMDCDTGLCGDSHFTAHWLLESRA